MQGDQMSACNDYAVELKGVTFKRGERSIFDNVDIAIPRGKVTAIMGPSGCGKTTLLRLIAAQLMPARGEVWVAGNNLPSLRAASCSTCASRWACCSRAELCSPISTCSRTSPSLRVHTRLPDEMIRDIVLMKLQAVGLRGAIELMPDELSGGMKRRVELARAIALDPQILMYDEPFAGQDPIAMGVLVRLIRLLNDALGITSIVVSHDRRNRLHRRLHLCGRRCSGAWPWHAGRADGVGQSTHQAVHERLGGRPGALPLSGASLRR